MTPWNRRHTVLRISGTTIVGTYANSLVKHGFSYNGTSYTTLDDPLATGGTIASGISGSTIVGYYFDGTGTHGFSYDGTSYTTLDDPLANDVTYAYGVSGSTIVGYYGDGTANHGFEATLAPEPASLCMLGLGAAMLFIRRRRSVSDVLAVGLFFVF